MSKVLLVTCSHESNDVIAKLEVRITELTCFYLFIYAKTLTNNYKRDAYISITFHLEKT